MVRLVASPSHRIALASVPPSERGRPDPHTCAVSKREAVRSAGPAALVVLAIVALLGWIGYEYSQWPPPPPTSSVTSSPEPTPDPTKTPAPSGRSLVVLGDAYAAGEGASKGQGWVTLLGDDLGWKVENLARKGAGYTETTEQEGCTHPSCDAFATLLEGAETAAPGIVMVTGGRKDALAPDGITAAQQLVTDVRARYPDAELVVMPPLWDDSPVPESLKAFNGALRDATEGARGTFLDVGQPLTGRSELIVGGAPGVLPNDDGHQAIARAVEEALRDAGLVPAS
jgi:acyl-CoA thioesterase-1